MSAETVTVITLLGTGVSICIAYLGFMRNAKHDEKSEGEADGVVMTELGYIKSGIDDLKRSQREQDRRYVETMQSIAEIKTSLAQAHTRIDNLEHKGVEHYEN